MKLSEFVRTLKFDLVPMPDGQMAYRVFAQLITEAMAGLSSKEELVEQFPLAFKVPLFLGSVPSDEYTIVNAIAKEYGCQLPDEVGVYFICDLIDTAVYGSAKLSQEQLSDMLAKIEEGLKK